MFMSTNALIHAEIWAVLLLVNTYWNIKLKQYTTLTNELIHKWTDPGEKRSS
jgi:hypothetical protein